MRSRGRRIRLVPADIVNIAAKNLALARRSLAWWRLLCWVIALAAAIPVLGVVTNLFAIPGAAMTHLVETVLGEIIANTLALALIVAIGTTVIGVATAWLVTMCRFPGSRGFELALLLPLAMPAYIIGYAYTDFLAFAGPLQTMLRSIFGWRRGDYWFPDLHTLGGAGVVLALVLYPYVYLLARAAFLEQATGVIEASRTLGAGPWRAFLRVALPLARPAIAAGVALALMETLADFGTVQYFGLQTFTTAIYRTWFGMGDRAAAAQLSAGLLVVMFVLLAFERHARGAARYHETTRRQRPPRVAMLRGLRAFVAICVCAAPVLLGFVVPVLILLALHLDGGDSIFGTGFLRLAANSLLLALLAALATMTAAVVLGYGLRHARDAWTRIAIAVATMGYALPGTVIAVGTVIWLARFDNALDATMRATFGVSTGLLISGSILALIVAYMVRFLAAATSAVDSGLGRVTPSMDDAGRTLGARPWRLMREVHVPMMTSSLLTGVVIVFVEVIKELPATLLVRPFNFDTLAIRVYAYASDERLAQASTAALAIVAVSLVPVAIISGMIRHVRTPRDAGRFT
jgi:iron(III) transport system permease protein